MHTHIQVFFTNSVCTYRFTRIQLCFLEIHVYVTCIYLSGSVRSMPKQQLAMYPWSHEYTFCDCWGTGDVISDCVGWPFWSKNWRKSQNAPAVWQLAFYRLVCCLDVGLLVALLLSSLSMHTTRCFIQRIPLGRFIVSQCVRAEEKSFDVRRHLLVCHKPV